MYRLLFLSLFFLLPTTVGAVTTKNYVCADFTQTSGTPVPSCASDIITLVSGTGQIFNVNSGLQVAQGVTLYLSAVVAGSGTAQARIAGDVNDGTLVNFTGTLVAEPVVSPSGNANNGLMFRSNSSFSGTIASICVTDTAGACEGNTPIEPQVFSPTTTPIVNPNQDYFNGVLLFFLLTGGVIFIFKKS